MHSSKETKVLNVICIGLVLMSGVIRLVAKSQCEFSYNSLIFTFFIAATFIWICQLQRRLVQSDIRRNLIRTAVMIILLMMMRTVKYEFLPGGHFICRYIWYLYYFPQTFGVLFMFFTVLHINRPYGHHISSWWKLLYIPASAIVIGILTNDFHQLAFYFPNGLSEWYENSYIHGPLYYIAMMWMIVLFAAILVIVFAKCAVPRNRKRIWMPMVPLAVGIISCTTFFVKEDSGILFMFKIPEIVCFVFAAFMESLILAHLIPSNDSYGDFWNASTIAAGIVDKDGVIRYRSEKSLLVSAEQIEKAQNETVLLEDGNISLKSQAIQGGFGYWTRDISQINQLNHELEELGDVLAEENSMLEAENRIEEKRIHIEEQSKLYDDLAKSVKGQIEELDKLLETLPEDEKDFEQAMKYACILNAYIKRHSNLLLLLHQSESINGTELSMALAESLEYVNLFGVKSVGVYRGENMIPGEYVILVYELFEAALEAGLPDTNAVLVNLDILEDSVSFNMEMSSPKKILFNTQMIEKIKELGGTVEIETEGDTEYVSLHMMWGGESI